MRSAFVSIPIGSVLNLCKLHFPTFHKEDYIRVYERVRPHV